MDDAGNRRAALDNIVLIMYRPLDVVNVGGVVRVMSNFGLRRLRLIEPAAFDEHRVRRVAHHAADIVEAIEHYDELADALADCTFVVGTSGRPHGALRERLEPRTAAPTLITTAARGERVAILYGPENDGLPNSALDLCHAILTIPTDPEHHSLNLAQAALVVAYELWLAAHDTSARVTLPTVGEVSRLDPSTTDVLPNPTQPAPVDDEPQTVLAALLSDARLAAGTDREALFTAMRDMLYALYPDTTERRVGQAMANLRAVMLRAVPRSDETKRLTALFAHAARRLREAPPEHPQ